MTISPSTIDNALQSAEQFNQEQREESRRAERKEYLAARRKERERRETLAKCRQLYADTINVRTSYNGRAGCMCGCLGTYSEEQGTIRRRLTKIITLIKDGFEFTHSSGFGDERYILAEKGDRRTAVYYEEK